MEVSPEKWKEASIHSVKLAQTVISRSDRGLDESRKSDPLPLLREACVKKSNDRIHAYVRATRTVVMKLRMSLLATNEEIKSLNRGKEALEKALEHKRKDLALNQQSVDIRSCRPPREKVQFISCMQQLRSGTACYLNSTRAQHLALRPEVETFKLLVVVTLSQKKIHFTYIMLSVPLLQEMDGADRLLIAERSHLLSLKRSLESQLRKVQQQLQVLNIARARQAAIIQERSRVTDLLCHSMSSNAHTSGFTRPNTIPNVKTSMKGHIKSYSAPAPLHITPSQNGGWRHGSDGSVLTGASWSNSCLYVCLGGGGRTNW